MEQINVYDELECLYDSCVDCPYWTGTECNMQVIENNG